MPTAAEGPVPHRQARRYAERATPGRAAGRGKPGGVSGRMEKRMPEIRVNTNGPYLLDASGLQLTDASGAAIALPQGSKVALCRCGHSASKPFCDGEHKRAGFSHDPSAG